MVLLCRGRLWTMIDYDSMIPAARVVYALAKSFWCANWPGNFLVRDLTSQRQLVPEEAVVWQAKTEQA